MIGEEEWIGCKSVDLPLGTGLVGVVWIRVRILRFGTRERLCLREGIPILRAIDTLLNTLSQSRRRAT